MSTIQSILCSNPDVRELKDGNKSNSGPGLKDDSVGNTVEI